MQCASTRAEEAPPALSRAVAGDNPGFVKLRKIDTAKDIATTVARNQGKVYLNSDSLLINVLGNEQLAEEGLTSQDRENAMLECLEAFTKLWNERRGKETGTLDFVSALANADATSDMDPAVDPVTYIGTLMLLIVGGNDTTRNTISGGVMALNEFPEQYEKLRNDPSLIPTFVDEAIRWQTPLAHMRRTATRDTILGGQQIKKGDKIVMWYVSANRDETAIERASEFLIDRADAKRHLSFGWGKHFCMGSRIAEMQVRVLWEEILERFRKIEVVGEPQRVRSCFVKGYKSLPVRVHPW